MSEIDDLRDAVAKMGDAFTSLSKKLGSGIASDGLYTEVPANVPGCSIKSLPRRLLIKAASHAVRINPVNAPMRAPISGGAGLGAIEPMKIAVLTAKYWGPTPRTLSVSFMESTPTGLRSKILDHMNAWTQTACISFAETSGTGDVRISREGSGYWSYLGTDTQLIPKNRPTMNLQAFSLSTPDSEYRRVVRHETGHTLGFPHEHMRKELIARINPQKAYKFFLADQGWDNQTVDEQVLTPLDDASLIETPADQTSIMCYQLPGTITKDGKPITGGTDINTTDFAFAGRIYPKTGATLVGAAAPADSSGDWDPSEDV